MKKLLIGCGILFFLIITLISISGCISLNNTQIKTPTPSPQVNVMQIVGTWHGENNLTYTFDNHGNATVIDDSTANDYYNRTIGYGHWNYIGYYIVNIDQAASENHSTNFEKIFRSLGSFSIINDSGTLYFYDNRTPLVKYYKVS